jgi:hypothetical protein
VERKFKEESEVACLLRDWEVKIKGIHKVFWVRLEVFTSLCKLL